MSNDLTLSPILVDAVMARYLLGDISKTTLWRIVRSGKLNPIKLGRKTMFRRDDIESFVTTLEVGGRS